MFFSVRLGKYENRFGAFDGLGHTVWPNVLSAILLADADKSIGIDFRIPKPVVGPHDGVVNPKYIDVDQATAGEGEQVLMI